MFLFSVREGSSEMPLMVTLQSSDFEKFVIEADVAKKSILVKNLLDDLPEDDEAIPIPLVNATILKKVLTWMQQHKVYSIIFNDTQPDVYSDTDIDTLIYTLPSGRPRSS